MSTTPTNFTLKDGSLFPSVAFGTGTAWWMKDAEKACLAAIEAGFVHFDTAQLYQNEETLGAAIAASGKPRESLFVTTKLKAPLLEGDNVRELLKESLKKLRLDYVDLFLVHAPVKHAMKLTDIWKEMEAVKKEGLTKSIGVSNFKVAHLEEILSVATIKPTQNQIEFHPYDLEWAEPIIEFGKKHEIVTSSYGGMTPLTHLKDGPVTPVVASIRESLEKRRGQPVSDTQVLMKWILQKGVAVITTSTKSERMREYLDVFDVPDLSAEEVRAIDEAGRHIEHRRSVMQSQLPFAL